MHTQERQLSVPHPARFDRVVSWAVRKLTSSHGKRILFIASLYFQMARIDPKRRGVVSRLNTLMALAKSDRALTLPIAIRGIVWKGADLSQILTEQDLTSPITFDRARVISDTLVRRAPECLHYGKHSEMQDDVINLLNNSALLAKAA